MAFVGDNLRRGPWLEEEDERLTTFVKHLGERKWDSIARVAGLKRSGKSCRLRWLNYLRPNLKRGHITAEEEEIIIQLHQQWGNKWSRIARRLPGRTDNEIKNYWRTHLRKKIEAAQEEGNFECKINTVVKDFWYEEANTSAWKYNIEDHIMSMEASMATSNFSLDRYDCSSNLTYFCSPHDETRIFNWNQNHGNSCLEDEHSETSTLEYSLCSLWELD